MGESVDSCGHQRARRERASARRQTRHDLTCAPLAFRFPLAFVWVWCEFAVCPMGLGLGGTPQTVISVYSPCVRQSVMARLMWRRGDGRALYTDYSTVQAN